MCLFYYSYYITNDGQSIIEKLDDNTVKATNRIKSDVTVELKNDNSERVVSYYPNERVAEYKEIDKDNNLSEYNFDENGMLTNVWNFQG